jgi:hypothetical protein
MPVVLATQEAEVGGSLESRRKSWALGVEDSLGNLARPHFNKIK